MDQQKHNIETTNHNMDQAEDKKLSFIVPDWIWIDYTIGLSVGPQNPYVLNPRTNCCLGLALVQVLPPLDEEGFLIFLNWMPVWSYPDIQKLWPGLSRVRIAE